MPPWTVHSENPVIAPGTLHPEFDVSRASAAHVIETQDGFRMVYWGSDSAGLNYILQADAPFDHPNRWRPRGTPLVGPQADSTLNSQGPSFPFLLQVSATRCLLYYTGWGERSDGKLPNTTGVAVSDDGGIDWAYHPGHPIIPLDRAYDSEGTGSLWVLVENGRFRMYYTAIGRYYPRPEGVETGHGDTIPEIGIAYAESEDGIHWEKPVDHLLVAPRAFGVKPYEYICSKPCVIRTPDGYVMWINTFGTAYRVHRLTSSDGLRWEWSDRIGPDGELGTGPEGSFDDRQRSYPTVVSRDGTLHCWFTGNDFGATGIGYAVSESPG